MSNVNNDVVHLAEQIETLAKSVQLKLNNGEDILATANELSRNSLTFVFMVGALYEQNQSNKKSIKTTVVKGPKRYHNVRDNFGRFARV